MGFVPVGFSPGERGRMNTCGTPSKPQ